VAPVAELTRAFQLVERQVRTGTSSVHVLEAGCGDPPVVLLHGGGADRAHLSWRHALPAAARFHRVLAPDLPGHGRTPPLQETPTTEAYVRWLREFLDVLGLDRVVPVGLSMGGAIALGYTLENPHRVGGLMLVASYGLTARVPFHGVAWWLLRTPLARGLRWGRRSSLVARWALRYLVGDLRTVPPDLVADAIAAVRDRTSRDVFYSWLRTELRRDRVRTCYLDRLSEVRVPVLLVHGDRDRVVPVTGSQKAAQRIPGARLEILQGCGHWPPRERPEAFNQLLAGFLSSLRTPGLP